MEWTEIGTNVSSNTVGTSWHRFILVAARTVTLLASQKGRVRKRNSTLMTRQSSVWKLPMGASDTEFDHLSRKHPAVLRSIPLGVLMVHF